VVNNHKWGNYCGVMRKTESSGWCSNIHTHKLFISYYQRKKCMATEDPFACPESVVLAPRYVYTLTHHIHTDTSVAALVCQPTEERSSPPSCLLQRTAWRERSLVSTEHPLRNITIHHVLTSTCKTNIQQVSKKTTYSKQFQ